MDIAVSREDLRDAARECAVMGHAVTLARWIGTGRRQVTAGQVLRKADVPAAGAALGVDVPPRLRTMADIPALHRPWCAAVATGLLQVGGGWVIAGPALECWPPGDADLLAGWLAGLRAVCAGTGDEEAVRVRDAAAPGGKITYTYDLGACWEHEITLEQTLPRDHGQDYPVCVEYRGDSPVEYWSEDDPADPEPFGLAEVNRKLAALGRETE